MIAGYVVSNIKMHLDNVKNINFLEEDYEKIRNSPLTLELSI